MPSRAELVVRANVLGLSLTNYTNDSKLEQKVLFLEKRASTQAGALGVQTVTSNATAPANNDTVTVETTAYTAKTALSEVAATSTLTSNATTPTDGDSVVINGQQYIFRTALTNTTGASNEVLIGGSAANALSNLKAAINNSGVAGTNYALNLPLDTSVTGTTLTATTLVIVAKSKGAYANTYVTKATSVGTTLSFTGATLAGGVDPVRNEVLIGGTAAAFLTNLKAAINGSGVEGTNYSTGTKAHPSVSGTTLTATTLVVQALDFSRTNASIATTAVGATLTWGAATLAGGTANVAAVNSVFSAAISGDANI